MTDKAKHFAKHLLDWFDKNGRKDLPWQRNKSFYEVWISEVMLQQTQVQTVIPYFEKFISKFPTVQSMSAASEDEVLQLWAGLGYYARARNLHKTAKIVAFELDGEFPKTLDEMLALPGLGRSTASAILSIADNQSLAILDGNVKRFISRLYAIKAPMQQPKTIQQMWLLSEALTPTSRNADYTQATMDLGATVCTRKNPSCPSCPVSNLCDAFKQGIQKELPVSKRTLKRTTQHMDCLVFTHKGMVMLTRRPSKGLWGGLNTPIIQEDTDDLRSSFNNVHEQHLPIRKHVFTHIDLFYKPIVCELEDLELVDGYEWHELEKALQLALPRPIQKLLQELKDGTLIPQLDFAF